jgi:undecaprenyl pyrophosphate phosphatase UppP
MTKVLLLSILLVVVYQFDELVRGVLRIIQRLMRHKHKLVIKDSDHYVGTALTIAMMPLMLYEVMLSDNSLTSKLLWLGGLYMAFAVIATGIGYFLRQLSHLRTEQGVSMVLSAAGIVGGMFHPSMSLVPWHAGRERLTYAKLALLLSVPALVGAAFKSYYDNYQPALSEYMEVLIIVMVGGLFINIATIFLENYFRTHDLGVLSYFRIVAGLAIALVLLR